jgi:hypothetical protein
VQAVGLVSAIGVVAVGDTVKGVLAVGRLYAEGVKVIRLDSLSWIVIAVCTAVAIMLSNIGPSLISLNRSGASARPCARGNFRIVLACVAILALGVVKWCVQELPAFRPAPMLEPKPVPRIEKP